MTKFIVFDTETTGFIFSKSEIVQLSYILYDTEKREVLHATTLGDDIVQIKSPEIPKEVSDIHGITIEDTRNKQPIKKHIDDFIYWCNQADIFVGHNIGFDIGHISAQINKLIEENPENETYRVFLEKFDRVETTMKNGKVKKDLPEKAYCTMKESRTICQLKINEKLMELHKRLFKQEVGGQLHNALVDISVTLRVYLKLTMDIDICKDHTETSSGINTVSNDNEICSLINPQEIQPEKEINSVKYDGKLISGVSTEGKITDVTVETDENRTKVSICDNNVCKEMYSKGGHKKKTKKRNNTKKNNNRKTKKNKNRKRKNKNRKNKTNVTLS